MLRRTVLRLGIVGGLWLIVPITKSLAGFKIASGYTLRRHPRPVIEAIQRTLIDKGYDPGPVDGRWGPKTEGALTAFMRVHDLPVEMVMSEELMMALWGVSIDSKTATLEEMLEFYDKAGIK